MLGDADALAPGGASVTRCGGRGAVHRRGKPVHRRGTAVHRRGKPVHRRGKPVHRRGTAVHRHGKPVHRRGKPVHHRGRPVHRRGKPMHRRGTAVHRRVTAVHHRGKPVHRRGTAAPSRQARAPSWNGCALSRQARAHRRGTAVHCRGKLRAPSCGNGRAPSRQARAPSWNGRAPSRQARAPSWNAVHHRGKPVPRSRQARTPSWNGRAPSRQACEGCSPATARRRRPGCLVSPLLLPSTPRLRRRDMVRCGTSEEQLNEPHFQRNSYSRGRLCLLRLPGLAGGAAARGRGRPTSTPSPPTATTSTGARSTARCSASPGCGRRRGRAGRERHRPGYSTPHGFLLRVYWATNVWQNRQRPEERRRAAAARPRTRTGSARSRSTTTLVYRLCGPRPGHQVGPGAQDEEERRPAHASASRRLEPFVEANPTRGTLALSSGSLYFPMTGSRKTRASRSARVFSRPGARLRVDPCVCSAVPLRCRPAQARRERGAPGHLPPLWRLASRPFSAPASDAQGAGHGPDPSSTQAITCAGLDGSNPITVERGATGLDGFVVSMGRRREARSTSVTADGNAHRLRRHARSRLLDDRPRFLRQRHLLMPRPPAPVLRLRRASPSTRSPSTGRMATPSGRWPSPSATNGLKCRCTQRLRRTLSRSIAAM